MRHLTFGLGVFLFVAALVPPASGETVTISVDPGPLGRSDDEIVMWFDDLNGTPLEGQTFNLDFVFDGVKQVAVHSDVLYNVQARFFTDGGIPGEFSIESAFLSDLNGSPILSDSLPGWGWGYGSFEAAPLFEANGVVHHDVHYEGFTFPDDPGVQVTRGWLMLAVGYGSLDVIPEPSTIVLLTTAALALLLVVRRRW